MSAVEYDYELDLELDLELNFIENIIDQFGEIADLLIKAKQPNLSSFEFADLMYAITDREDTVAHIVKEAQELAIKRDFVEDVMKELQVEKKQIITARNDKYETDFGNDYFESKLKLKELKTTTDIEINNVIAARLKMMRWKLRLSRDQLGVVIGVSAEQLDNYERGIERISDDKIKLLTEHFRISASYFFVKPLIEKDEHRSILIKT